MFGVSDIPIMFSYWKLPAPTATRCSVDVHIVSYIPVTGLYREIAVNRRLELSDNPLPGFVNLYCACAVTNHWHSDSVVLLSHSFCRHRMMCEALPFECNPNMEIMTCANVPGTESSVLFLCNYSNLIWNLFLSTAGLLCLGAIFLEQPPMVPKIQKAAHRTDSAT